MSNKDRCLTEDVSESEEDYCISTKEVVLRGWAPWGFTVEGGSEFHSILRVTEVLPGGKAASDGGLMIGDWVRKINDVAVFAHAEAQELIDGAFRTLSVTVTRGNLDQAAATSPGSASFLKKAHELRGEDELLEKAKDDSIVYSETPNKKYGAKLKSQRRGESFNLKSNGPANTWQPPDGEPTVPPTAKRKWSFKRLAFGNKRSSSSDVSKESANVQLVNYGASSGASPPTTRAQTLPAGVMQAQSTSSLPYYSGAPSLLSDPPMPRNAPPPWPDAAQFSSQSTSNLDYSHSNGYNEGGKDSEQTKEYRSVFEYKMAQINKSYSSSDRSPSDKYNVTAQDAQTRNTSAPHSKKKQWRSTNNYENMSVLETGNTSLQTQSASHLGNKQTDQVNSNPMDRSVPSIPAQNFVTQDDGYLGGVAVPPSSSGLRYSHSMGHVGDKAQAWPNEPVQESQHTKANNSRTNSWSDAAHPDTQKPRKLAFPTRLNTHAEDKMNTKDTKRHLQEMRMRGSPKDSPIRQPMVAKKDSLGDMSRVFKFDELTTRTFMQSTDQETKLSKDTATSPPLPNTHPPQMSKSHPPQLTTPKRLHTAPKLQSKSPKDSAIIDDHNWDVVQTPSAGYMYIVRQKPCYNTSTQTEGLESSLGSPHPLDSSGISPAPVTKEERGIQARPGSIVAATLSQSVVSGAKKSIGVGQDEHDLHGTEHKDNTVKTQAKKSVSSGSETSETKSPSEPKYWIHADDMAKINDNPDQSDMLRKLSQEYFTQRRFSGSSKNLNRLSGSSDREERQQRRKSAEMDSRIGSELSLLQSDYESHKRESSVGDRERKISVEGRTADKVDLNDNVKSNDKSKVTHGKSNSSSHAKYSSAATSHQSYSSQDSNIKRPSAVTKSADNGDTRAKDSPTMLKMNTHQIAERARMEYVESGAFQKYGGAPKQLKRTVSEQLRPLQERTRRNQSETETPSGSAGHDHLTGVSHSHQTSDPVLEQNQGVHRERILSSDLDAVFRGKSFDSRGQRLSSARSSSSSSGHSREEERGKASDNELKRLQHQAVLNFYEIKTGKRLSSSSIDSTNIPELLSTPKDKNACPSPDWRGNKSASPYRIEEQKLSKKPNVQPMTLDVSSRRSTGSSGGSGYDSIRSSNVADTSAFDAHSSGASKGYHSHTSSGATTASSLSPRGDPYSPPLHPWPSDMAKLTEESESSDRMKDQMEDSEDDVTELKSKFKATLADEAQAKSMQYSTSSNESTSTTPGASMGPENTRFTYNLGPTVNRQTEDVDESESPPVLPPRNYRNFNIHSPTARQVPQPQEPLTRDRLSTGNQSDSQRSSTSSFQDVFSTDYDQTPERDSYADQLRQQSRRISQSQATLLAAARYQSKPVEVKANVSVAVSRPVEKNTVKQETHVPEPYRRSGDFSGQMPSMNSANPSWDSDNRQMKSRRSDAHHSPQHSITSDVTRVTHHSPQASFSSDVRAARLSPHHSPQQSIASNSSKSSSNSRGSRHSPQPSFSSDINRGPHHSPQQSFTSDVSRGSHHSPQSSLIRDMSDVNTKGHHHSPQQSFSRESNDSQFGGAHRGSPNITRESSSLTQSLHVNDTSGSRAPLKYSHELEDLLAPRQSTHHKYSPDSSFSEESKQPPQLPKEDESDEQRFSSDSYLNNKSYYRQGFGGNYHRNGEVSPTPPNPNPDSVQTPTRKDESSPTSNSISQEASDSMIQVTPKIVPLGKQRDNSSPVNLSEYSRTRQDIAAWRPNKVFTPVRPAIDMQLTSHNVDTPPNSGRTDERTDSPSVKDLLANFEKHGNDKRAKATPVGRTKVQELRESLLRRSNENLQESPISEGKRSRSGSKENVFDIATPSRYERLRSSPVQNRKKRSHSEDNLVDSIPIAPEVSSTPQTVQTSKSVNHTTSAISETTHSSESSPSESKTNICHNKNVAVPQQLDNERKISPNVISSDDVTGHVVTSSQDYPQHKHTDSSHSGSQSDIRSNDSGVLEDIASSRQKSAEELECDKQAAIVASHLGEQEKELSNVLLPPPAHKTTTDYITPLFDTRVNLNRKPSVLAKTSASDTSPPKKKPSALPENNESPNKNDPALPLPPTSPYWSPPSLAHLRNKMRQDGVSPDQILKDVNTEGSMDGEKETLIGRIEKKLEILREEKEMLVQEIEENNNLGKEVTAVVESKVTQPAEMKKYHLYVTELDKVICLLLNVSGRLARAENAVMSLSEDAGNKEKRAVTDKRDELLEKLEDAKLLKEGIDRRSNQVAVFLKKYLQTQEYEDYEHFIKMKSKLTVDQQDVEDKLKLGEEQLAALRKSLTQSTC